MIADSTDGRETPDGQGVFGIYIYAGTADEKAADAGSPRARVEFTDVKRLMEADGVTQKTNALGLPGYRSTEQAQQWSWEMSGSDLAEALIEACTIIASRVLVAAGEDPLLYDLNLIAQTIATDGHPWEALKQVAETFELERRTAARTVEKLIGNAP